MDNQKLTDDDFKQIFETFVNTALSERSICDGSDYSVGRCSVCYEVLDTIVKQRELSQRENL